MHKLFFVVGMFAFTCIASAHAAEPTHVVVSFKPLHSLVASVMEGSGEPILLIKNSQSPHDFTLRPSQAKQLQQAEVIFYIGDGFEHFLKPVFKGISLTSMRVAMADTSGISLLPVRHGDGHDHDHADEGTDMHFFLSPHNAVAMVRTIEATLTKRYPQNEALYHRNAKALIAKLEALDHEMKTRLGKLHAPFIVFHDAYHYLEEEYGLKGLASVTFSPETLISARHITDIRAMIRDQHVKCIFSEPEFEPRLMRNIAQGTEAKVTQLDPEATAFAPDKNLYFTLMESLMAGFESCLATK